MTAMLIFRQMFDPRSSTYTYLLADSATREAVLIDSVYEQVQRDAALLDELGLTLAAALETHIHADHVTGAWLLRARTGCTVMLAAAANAEGADRGLEDDDRIRFGSRHLRVLATPGHTASCLTFVLDDNSRAFTGDCLLIRGCGRTDFQDGDAATLYRSVHRRLFALPDDCRLYPGHDYRGLTATSVGEEKRYNPRLGGDLSESDFVGSMASLELPHPKQIDVAVPANLRCGRPPDGAAGADAGADGPDWAPLCLTFAGIWEIEPQWLEEHPGIAQLVDVREAHEFAGPLGRIPGAVLIPLGELAQRAGELDAERPVVAICRAGGRSAQATVILQRAGFARLANLPGGMLRWRAEGRAVAGGAG